MYVQVDLHMQQNCFFFPEDPSLACKVTVNGLTKITCVLCSPADILSLLDKFKVTSEHV